ncbi:MAG: acyltransferase [Clostridia bacterium]|nr:acyltransferase [Clostridia bacterium]
MNLLRKIRNIIRSWLGVDYGPTISDMVDMGMKVGKNFRAEKPRIDVSHCWLISIGDNVVFAPNVYLLAHDASTKNHLGYTKIGRISIGNNTFLGADVTVMPNVKIGDNCIIGTGSVVTKDVPDNTVYAGNPARFICTLEDYLEKNRKLMESHPVYDYSYTLGGNIDSQKKNQMVQELEDGIGYVE